MKAWCAIASLFVGAAGFAAEPPLACKKLHIRAEKLAAIEDLESGRLPIPDYLSTVAACRGTQVPPLPASAWLEAERARYADVLAKQPADILVVPFQVQGYGLDRIERALMTADLAYAIGDSGTLRVADPFLTALALGEGERRIDEGTVLALAQKIGAKWILSGYAGHDLQRRFTLTLQLRERHLRSPSDRWQRDWRSLSFTEARTPAYVLHDMLPAVIKELPLNLTWKRSHATATTTPSSITALPAELVTAPASGVAVMNLIATTLPNGAERARERLFERALLLAMRSDATKSSPRFFESYSLLNLHRRPVALARIDGATGPSFDALRALLDGNLPAAQAATREVKNPLEELLLQIMIRDLEYAYRIEELSQPPRPRLFDERALASWAPLLVARLEDRNNWRAADAEEIKTALDEAFPVTGLDLNSLIHGNSVARDEDVDHVDVDLANIRHARKVIAQLETAPCCRSRDLRPTRWDLLWALEGAAEYRISRALAILILQQGLPDRAMQTMARYETLLKGNPYMTAMSALAVKSMAQKSPDDERGNWNERAAAAGRAALRWSPGQNQVANWAARSLGIPTPDTEIWVDVYGYDFPRRPFWPLIFIGVDDDTAEPQRLALASEAHAFSTSDIDTLTALSGRARDAAVAALGSRFTGSSGRPAVLTAAASAPKAPVDRIATLRAKAETDPNMHIVLGHVLFDSDAPLQEALDAFLAYPAFRTGKARNAVGLSNEAFDVGSRFYWIGRGDLAKPLLKIAANLQTGSDASLASEQRLRLMAGDFSGAAEIARRRTVRYSSSYAQRDYLSLLHAMGQHDAAWSAFTQLHPAQGHPALWTAALVGHRIQKLDERRLRAWLAAPEIRDAKFQTERFASYYAVLWSSTDRTPPADLGQLVEKLEGTPTARIDSGFVVRPNPENPGDLEMVEPTFSPGNQTSVPAPANGTPVKSQRAYFAEAYSAVARGEYPKAVERFAAMARFYPLDGAAMPYLAYAASKTGDSLKFEAYVSDPHRSDLGRFPIVLARAFYAAGRKQNDEAYRQLALAFRFKPYESDMPIDVHYQFAEACEWLYRDTKDPRFLAMLLEWAKAYQSVQPVAAWAYAVQYQYEKDASARTRALAMALHLDPLSNRISSASASEIKEARAWFAQNNPFRIDAAADEDDVQRTATSMPRRSTQSPAATRIARARTPPAS
jgi:hypothetical protein